jgi:hypothetical protein
VYSGYNSAEFSKVLRKRGFFPNNDDNDDDIYTYMDSIPKKIIISVVLTELTMILSFQVSGDIGRSDTSPLYEGE